MTAFFALANNYIPHGHCFLWQPALLWTMVSADALIALAYFSIPAALLTAVRRQRNHELNRIYVLFSLFIMACGTTHLFAILVIWQPQYWLEAGVKVLTAAISLLTAVVLWPVARRAGSYVTEQQDQRLRLHEANLQLQHTLHDINRQRTDLDALNRFADELTQCETPQEAGKVVSAVMARLLPDSCGSLLLLDDEGIVLEAVASWGQVPNDPVLRPSDCRAFRMGKTHEQHEADKVMTCSYCSGKAAEVSVCRPVRGNNEVIGAMRIAGPAFVTDPQAENLISVVVNRAGLALAGMRLRASLERASTRDSLTQLFNRRYLDEELKLEAKRSERTKRPFSLVLFDLDHFKQVNDDHGHAIGDVALRVFSETLVREARGDDIPARLGGEEFVLLLPASQPADALQVARRICAAFARDCQRSNLPATVQLTASAGVAGFPHHATDIKTLLAMADEALYTAKREGRNRVVVASAGDVP